MVTVPAGGEVEMVLPGGGGFGDPHRRRPDLVREDVENELITPGRARSDYAVVVERSNGHWQVDEHATAALRGAAGAP
jgi:N-methylhydantoinase B/oxoprolinase/acetone carboxylase alpha subunit